MPLLQFHVQCTHIRLALNRVTVNIKMQHKSSKLVIKLTNCLRNGICTAKSSLLTQVKVSQNSESRIDQTWCSSRVYAAGKLCFFMLVCLLLKVQSCFGFGQIKALIEHLWIMLYKLYLHPSARSMNYGGIGAIIGHELTHGYDDWGKNGNLFRHNILRRTILFLRQSKGPLKFCLFYWHV